jgi:hypothetical protein
MTPEQQLRRMAITRQLIYLLVAAAIIFPFIKKGIKLPGEPTPHAVRFFEKMDALEPGSHVLISFDYDPAAKAELYPMSVAILRHCFAKDLIPVVMTHWPDGIGMCEMACGEVAKEFTDPNNLKISGRDYVFLGFRPGMSDVILKMGVDIKDTFPNDYFGKPTNAMPALEGLTKLGDVDLGIDIAAGNTVEVWITFGGDRHDFDMAAATTSVSAPKLYPFLDSDQLVGLLGGQRAAADYEKLIGRADKATSGMVAQSFTHLLLICLIVGANVWYFVGRLTGREGK